jgi:hypothetical protein
VTSRLQYAHIGQDRLSLTLSVETAAAVATAAAFCVRSDVKVVARLGASGNDKLSLRMSSADCTDKSPSVAEGV